MFWCGNWRCYFASDANAPKMIVKRIGHNNLLQRCDASRMPVNWRRKRVPGQLGAVDQPRSEKQAIAAQRGRAFFVLAAPQN